MNAKSASAYRAAFTAMADVVRTDRRAKIGLGIVAFAVFLAIFGPYITPYPTDVPETGLLVYQYQDVNFPVGPRYSRW